MQTVPFILGLAHSNGFPTEILIGWLFSHVFAIGTPAVRLTTLSSLFGVVSVASCYAISRLFGARPWLSLAAAALFGLTFLVCQHATRTDVIDCSVSLSALTMVLSIAAAKRDESTWTIVAGACFGLCLGTHAIVIFYLPAAIAAFFFFSRIKSKQKFALYLSAAIFCAGTVYSYLPIRSSIVERFHLDPTSQLGFESNTPIWDWGSPSSPSRFIGVVTGRSVGAPSVLGEILEPSRFLKLCAFFVR